jgi:hypothetical protein
LIYLSFFVRHGFTIDYVSKPNGARLEIVAQWTER